MMTYGEKERFKKLDYIVVLVGNKYNEGVDYDKLVSLLCYEWGMRKQKVIEYLDVLIGAEKLILKDKMVFYKDE